MAMRRGGGFDPSRPSGVGFGPNRPRVVVRPVFEDFKPMSERIQEKESEIIRVRLPGFLREQIKLSTESTNVFRVRGQRLVAGNRWSRFQEDFKIPEYCNKAGIRAMFQGGILTITMPKNTISNKSEASTTEQARNPRDITGDPKPPKVQEGIQAIPNLDLDNEKQRGGKHIRPPSPQKGESEPKPQKVQDETPKWNGTLEASIPQKGPSEATSQNETTPELKMSENARLDVRTIERENSIEASKESSKAKNVAKKVQEDIQAKPDLNPNTEKQRDGKSNRHPSPLKGANDQKPQKVQDETPKVTSTSHDDKQREWNGTIEAPGPQKGPSEAKSQTETAPELKMPENARLVKIVENEKKSSEESKESSKAKNIVKKVGRENEKRNALVGDYEVKAKDDPNGGKIRQITDIIGSLNEERQLMVNMGAAILVIVALGGLYMLHLHLHRRS